MGHHRTAHCGRPRGHRETPPQPAPEQSEGFGCVRGGFSTVSCKFCAEAAVVLWRLF